MTTPLRRIWCVALLGLAGHQSACAADLDPPPRPVMRQPRPAPAVAPAARPAPGLVAAPVSVAPPAAVPVAPEPAQPDWRLALQLRGGIFPVGLETAPQSSSRPLVDLAPTPAELRVQHGL
jgi:hypothetical protein